MKGHACDAQHYDGQKQTKNLNLRIIMLENFPEILVLNGTARIRSFIA